MESRVLRLDTGRNRAIVDVTAGAREFVAGKGDGLLSVYVPHATAGIAILETGAGSDEDFMDQLDVLFPRDDRWRHRHGSPGHGADHVIPGVVSPSVTVPVIDGRPALGTWQSIVVVDVNQDNPSREVRFAFLPG